MKQAQLGDLRPEGSHLKPRLSNHPRATGIAFQRPRHSRETGPAEARETTSERALQASSVHWAKAVPCLMVRLVSSVKSIDWGGGARGCKSKEDQSTHGQVPSARSKQGSHTVWLACGYLWIKKQQHILCHFRLPRRSRQLVPPGLNCLS